MAGWGAPLTAALLLAFGAQLGCAPGARHRAADPPAADAAVIASVVNAGRHPWLRWARFPAHQAELARIYAPQGFTPLWWVGYGPTPSARRAISLLADARAKGLDPRDYDAALFAAKLRAFELGRAGSPEDVALFDTALSVAMLRLLSDLHVGRVNPREVKVALTARPVALDLAARLVAAARDDRVAELAAQVEPRFPAYHRLLRALAEYRALARDPRVRPVSIAAPVRPGDAFDAAPELARYLETLRDLPAGAAPPQAIYAGELVEAVKRFQQRHGIDPSGVIDAATAQALGVPPRRRVWQIEIALERFRWLPDLGERRFLFVNVPAFELFAFEGSDPPEGPALDMRVVVGRAARTPTPVFMAELRSAVFRPYWNVPRSIAIRELLPELRRDSSYLDAHEMEIVSVEDASVLPQTATSVDALAAGTARLRQRPGPSNALGGVKFLLPNPYGVYLHDTPGRGVFERSRRDFSHGCVRVADALALAVWVLRDVPGWDTQRIQAAMQDAWDEGVALREPIAVVVFYATASAREDGTVSFHEDIYGRDAVLERALAAVAEP
jgi:murein L,D-transpeptidase YcbB/YkuD